MNAIVAALVLCPALLGAQVSKVAPADAPPRTVVAPSGEPGESLLISGTIFAEDGRTPLRAASVFVYQTDAKGIYNPANARDSDNPRLRAYMRTDAQGHYEFRTIRPGSYPGTRNPGHIHYHVNAPGYRERVFEIVFEGDTLIPAQWLRDAANPDAAVALVKLTPEPQRGARGVKDVTLRRE